MERMLKRHRASGLLLALALGLGSWSDRASAQPATLERPTSGAGWVDRSGFGELISQSIVEGTAAGTLAGVALLDPADPATAVRVVLGGTIGAAAGLAFPLLLSQGEGREVRTGDVVFMGAAHGLGMANGFFFPLAIQLVGCEQGTSALCSFGSATFDQIRLDAALGATLSLGAGAATLLVSRQMSFTPGQAEALGSASLWGAMAGFLLAHAASPSYASASLYIGASLAGADAGFAAAFFLRNLFDVDRARIHLLDVGVFLGAGLGVAVAYFISPTFANATGVSLSVLAGSAAGWVVAYFATGELDGFKRGLPPEKATASLGTPAVRPLASLVRGQPAVGIQVDLLQGRF